MGVIVLFIALASLLRGWGGAMLIATSSAEAKTNAGDGFVYVGGYFVHDVCLIVNEVGLEQPALAECNLRSGEVYPTYLSLGTKNTTGNETKMGNCVDDTSPRPRQNQSPSCP